MRTEPPTIVLIHEREADRGLVDAFLHGCEEESVPARAEIGTGDSGGLAKSAAAMSALFIGAGIDASNGLVVCEQRLGSARPVLSIGSPTVRDVRTAGVIAGRLARGRPAPEIRAVEDMGAAPKQAVMSSPVETSPVQGPAVGSMRMSDSARLMNSRDLQREIPRLRSE